MRHVAAAKAKESKKCKSMLIQGDEGERRCMMKEADDSILIPPKTEYASCRVSRKSSRLAVEPKRTPTLFW
jgi:hypothetical protein